MLLDYDAGEHEAIVGKPFRGLDEHTPIVVAGDFNDVWGNLGRLLEDDVAALSSARAGQPRAHGRAPASSCTRPASVAAQPVSHAAAIARSDREPLCT